MRTNYQKIIKIYYTALMTYLVFTFADKLLQGFIQSFFCMDFFLYSLLWGALVIQTTFAYIHIMAIPQENYNRCALFSDGIDICLEIYVCVAIGSTYGVNGYSELTNYLNLSIPFLILAVNQFCWYVIVREFNSRAILCLSILFFGMLAVTISECLCHGIWNLIIVVMLYTVPMAILRFLDKAPEPFERKVKPIWEKVINNRIVQKLFHSN